MPILEVEIVTRPNENLKPGLAAELANRTGEIFNSPPGTTWVKVRAIPQENYAENGSGEPFEVFPVFVSILKAHLPAPDALQAEASRLTEEIAQVCARPVENIHLFYLPEGAGRIAFGGKIVGPD